MEGFTPVAGMVGGLLIGLAAVGLLLTTGRIAGVSGIIAGTLVFNRSSLLRWLFIVGLIVGGWVTQLATGMELPVRQSMSMPLLMVAGLLVGYGTRLGGGCTSGHGVCGIGRISKRSIIATVVFMFVAIITVYITRHLLGWST